MQECVHELKPLLRHQKTVTMRNLLLTFVLILTFLASLKTTHCQGFIVGCLEPHETSRNFSCDFEMGPCGWQPIDGNSTWRLAGARYSNIYAEVPMGNKQENFTTRLYSPWLCPVQSKVYSMRFQYGIESDSRSTYSLSVLLSTGEDVEPVKIWTATSLYYWEYVGPLYIKCPASQLQVVFEAVKTNEEPCDGYFSSCDERIRLDNIQVNTDDFPKKSVFVTCPTPPSSTVPPSTSTALPQSSSTLAEARVSSQGSSDGCLGAGFVVGVVAGVIAFEIIVIVFVVVLRRRMTGNSSETPSIFSCFKPKQNSPSHDASQAVFDLYQNSPDPRAERMTEHLARAHADMNVATRGRSVQGSRPVHVNTVSSSVTHPLDSNETMTTNPPSQQSVTRSTGHFEEENQDYLIPRLPSSLHIDIVSGHHPENYEPLNMSRTDEAIYTQLTNTGQPPRNARRMNDRSIDTAVGQESPEHGVPEYMEVLPDP